MARNEDYLGFAETGAAAVPDDVVKARSAALSRLGVPEADAIAASLCPGVEAVRPAAERRRLCPPGPALIAIVGLPRRVRAGGLSGDSTGPGGGAQGDWVVRVLEMDISRGSRATMVVDYFIGRATSGWAVVKKERLFILE